MHLEWESCAILSSQNPVLYKVFCSSNSNQTNTLAFEHSPIRDSFIFISFKLIVAHNLKTFSLCITNLFFMSIHILAHCNLVFSYHELHWNGTVLLWLLLLWESTISKSGLERKRVIRLTEWTTVHPEGVRTGTLTGSGAIAGAMKKAAPGLAPIGWTTFL